MQIMQENLISIEFFALIIMCTFFIRNLLVKGQKT